jgi:hypothetical protein
MPICSQVDPPMLEVRENHFVACHLYPEAYAGASPATTTPIGHGGMETTRPAALTSPGGAS